MVAAAGGTVMAECQSASLRPLLQRLPGVSAAFVMGEPLPPFDLHVPLMSLPYLFGTTLESVPAEVPYLAPDPERLAAWRQRLSLHDGLRVGIVWAGKATPDPFRSCGVDSLAPLAEIPGVTLYSLQLGDPSRGLAAPPAGMEIVDLTAAITDFGDTAALVSLLDLVISIDTSVAHLAGALGKPVWLLLPMAGDYRWLVRRADSPWYPTMRIFRQDRQGEWGRVVERVAVELTEGVWPLVEQAAAKEPFNGGRIYQCGTVLAAQGRHREATVRYTKASQLLRNAWEPHYSLAASLQVMGRVAEARESLQTAVELAPGVAIVHEALGTTRQMQGDVEGALSSYQEALRLDRRLVKARFNLATLLKDHGRFTDALAEFYEVVRLAPDHADAHWNLAVLFLMLGDLGSGWREFSWRFMKSELPPVRKWQDHELWDGSPLNGRTILLYGEQGLGDTLQFVRYAPQVAARGGKVMVEVQSPSLVSLVSGVAGVSQVVPAGEALPQFDLQASLLDLPGIFGTELGSIPAEVPYLHADPALAPGAQALVPRDGSFRVGVVWCGNPNHQNDTNRSVTPEILAPLAGVPGVKFYSLHYGEESADLERKSALPLVNLSHAIRDFSDTASLAVELDLVITVDTSMAHLCGGLGLPVWVLIPFIPDWRWLLERDDSPWYPTMRLFRQQSAGEWHDVVLRVRGALEEAALAANPADVEMLNNYGCALDGAGRHLDAVACYQRAISLKSDFLAPHYNMGNSLRSLSRAEEAIEAYRRALSLDPNLTQGWHNLALALQDLGRLDEARYSLKRAITLQPDYLEARHNLGELYQRIGDIDAAVACFEEVLRRDHCYLPSWNALGIAFQLQYRLEEAVECYEKALSMDPHYLHALNNLGSVSKGLGMLDRAIDCYQRVLALDPDYADARWNLSLVQLLLGQYEEGWQGYEWRFKKVDPVVTKAFPQPLWDGTPLNGRVILLHSEQGFGDTFQFVRYAPLVARMGGTVLVECQSDAIAPVIKTVPGVAQVLVRGQSLPRFDVHAPLMSLPLLCGTRLATVPAEIPYVAADPALVSRWRARINGNGLRVGIVWAGRKSYKDDLKRSLNLGVFAPLAQVPGVSLFSLQVGDGAEQAGSPPPGMTIVNLGAGIRSFADTAAIIESLDLVISADTAVAHLTGALGKPVWVLLPTACDWRWLLEREDSPWYPTARLFRQRKRGEWGEVLERVAEALADAATDRRSVS
jgi:tetratricopeptide (TPR) repeat protein